MVSNLSRWKNLFGEECKKGSFLSLNPRNNINSDGSAVAVSPDFMAVNWQTPGGGAVAVFKTQDYCRVVPGFPLIRGHTNAVSSVKFSPFNSSLLATASDDGKVKLWSIPEEGIKEDLTVETQLYNGHSKKANLIEFNPCVKEIAASSGSDHDLHVWNITDSSVIQTFKTEDSCQSLEFDSSGSLVGVMTKNKKAHVYDIRNPDKSVLCCEAHESAKVQRFGFADANYAFSSGFSAQGARELKAYDLRAFDKPLYSHKLDTNIGALSHYYDDDSGLLFLYGKGESSIIYCEMKEGVHKVANTYHSQSQALSLAFFPKRTMNYNQCEIARCAKLTKTDCHYVNFKFPRRNEGFSEEFYPNCVVGEPSMTLDEWKAGENKPLERKLITEIENKFKTEMTFDKKVVEEVKSKSQQEVEKENEELKATVKRLEEELAELKAKLDA